MLRLKQHLREIQYPYPAKPLEEWYFSIEDRDLIEVESVKQDLQNQVA
jgi:hypothetical protein